MTAGETALTFTNPSNMTTTTKNPAIEANKITSSDIAEWMQAHAAKVHETHNHIQLRISLVQNATYPAKAKFSIYCGAGVDSGELNSIEECLSAIAETTPQTIAETKRRTAAKLISEAEEIEAQAATL